MEDASRSLLHPGGTATIAGGASQLEREQLLDDVCEARDEWTELLEELDPRYAWGAGAEQKCSTHCIIPLASNLRQHLNSPQQGVVLLCA
jgi:hypothetical protein